MGVLGGAPTDLLSFAVHYFFPFALFSFVTGVVYRVLRYLVFWRRVPKAPRRHRGFFRILWGLVMTFLGPIIATIKHKPHDFIFALLLMHLLGVIPVLFIMVQHVVSFAYLVPPYSLLQLISLPLSVQSSVLTVTSPMKPLSHMSYGFVNSLWGPLTVVLNGDVLALAAIVGVSFKLGYKAYESLKKLKYIKITDYFDLLLLLGILVTGYMAARHSPSTYWGTDVTAYDTLLGLHVLLASLLLALLPYTKYWHFVFGFWYGKLHEWYDLKIRRGAA